ncbi:MAG: TetR/AcrR family transcriptional regulator [Burkholderiaceae bacterium]
MGSNARAALAARHGDVDPGGRRQKRRRRAKDSPSLVAAVDERRERILKVAEQLFFQNGYSGTTMEMIVQALGVTKPYVYYYFRSKQAIFETLCWRPTVACFTALEFPDDDRRPAHEKLAAGLEHLVRETIAHYPAAFFTHKEPSVLTPEFRAKQLDLAHRFYDQMDALLEQARRDGNANFDDTRLTSLAACSLPGFLFTWYRPDGRLPAEDVVRELSKLVYRVLGLRIRARPRKPARSGPR